MFAEAVLRNSPPRPAVSPIEANPVPRILMFIGLPVKQACHDRRVEPNWVASFLLFHEVQSDTWRVMVPRFETPHAKPLLKQRGVSLRVVLSRRMFLRASPAMGCMYISFGMSSWLIR
jgi:hypothetical protein